MAFGLCFSPACGSYEVEGENEGEVSGSFLMNVELDNAEDFTSLFPLDVYLFDAANRCVYNDVASSAADIPVFEQAAGTYRLAVISGLSSGEYVYPMGIHPRQYLTFTDGCCADVPLITGGSHVAMDGDTDVSVTLSYAVASIYFSFPFFPSDVSGVEVYVSPVSSGITLGGDISNDNRTATVPCRKKGTEWVAGPVYVLPTDAARVHLSIKLKRGDSENVYGFDYNSSLKSGRVYRFVGNEDGNITLEGEFHVENWVIGEEVVLTPDDLQIEEVENPEKPEDAGEDGETVLYSDELPEAESVWGPFFAWKVTSLSVNSVEATLVAPRQWMVTVADASGICEAYEEDGIGDWRVFTLDEAEEFRDQYSSTILELSGFLEDYGFDGFNKYDLRYLCDDLKSTFSFENDRIVDAGKTVKYGLRLVKVVRVERGNGSE